MRVAVRLVVAVCCVLGLNGVTKPCPRDVPVQVVDSTAKLFGIVDANGPEGTSGPDAKRLGITLDRVDFTYGESVASMDAKVALDARNGLTPLPLLSQYGRISSFDQSGWQNWARTVVARYGPGGAFWEGRTDGRLAPTYFELLNEPYGYWFYPYPEPAAYASFFANVVTAAEEANPRAKFLLAASPHAFEDEIGRSSGHSWDVLLKLSRDGPRAERLAAGVTTHPYNSHTHPQGWLTTVATHKDFPKKQVWITEIGYRIGDPVREPSTNVKVAEEGNVTESVQAAWMRRTLHDFMSWRWARAYVWFKWADYGTANMWGVVRPDNSRRPSYNVYQAFISSGSQ
jgi:hypothetical protein